MELKERFEQYLLIAIAVLLGIFSLLDILSLSDTIPWLSSLSGKTPSLVLLMLSFLTGYLVFERRGKLDEISKIASASNNGILIIEEQTKRLNELSNVELLRSAREAGVVDLFPRANSERLQNIIEELKTAKGPVDIIGVALPTMVENEEFRSAIANLGRIYDVRIMLLDPECYEATRRRIIEEPLGRKTVADIIATSSWIQEQQINNGRFRLHYYEIPPMHALIITDQFAFMEPYHFGRPEGLEGCIGGHVPMMKIRNHPEKGTKNAYSFFKAHFEYTWNFTRGTRVNLPVQLLEAKESKYILLENQTSKNIAMGGWEIIGQESVRPFQFDSDFTWHRGERVVIARQPDELPNADKVFIADSDFMGNNTILRLTNGPGTLTNEWSIPQSIETA